jgi:hypothetical protein
MPAGRRRRQQLQQLVDHLISSFETRSSSGFYFFTFPAEKN